MFFASYYSTVVATVVFELKLRGVPSILNLYCCSVMTLKNEASYIFVLYIHQNKKIIAIIIIIYFIIFYLIYNGGGYQLVILE